MRDRPLLRPQLRRSPSRTVVRTRQLAFEALEGRRLLAVEDQPGALDGKIVYVGAGHGWCVNKFGEWTTERGISNHLVEDLGNQDQLSRVADYLFRAGATVVPLRPVGHQANEVVLDNVSPEVTFVGNWQDADRSQPNLIYYGEPNQSPYRYALTTADETAYARYRPSIPQSGYYPVYSWTRAEAVLPPDQRYRIHHAGGDTTVTVNHQKVGNGLVYLGTYYFIAGQSGYVDISNRSIVPGSKVIADAIRFGNGRDQVDRGGASKGTLREDEASIYWIESQLGVGTSAAVYRSNLTVDCDPDVGANVRAPTRWAAHMNRVTDPASTDSLYIGLHSNASDSRARGTQAIVYPGAETPHQELWATFVGDEVRNDLTLLSNSGRLEVSYEDGVQHIFRGTKGEVSNEHINGEFDATIIELAFHDNVSDAKLLRSPEVRDWMARAIYQSSVKYFRDRNALTNDVLLPEPVTTVSARALSSFSIEVQWEAPVSDSAGGAPATGYRVQVSSDGHSFSDATGPLSATTRSITLRSSPGQTRFYRVIAINQGGQSAPSPVVAARTLLGGLSLFRDEQHILLVDAFDRQDRQLATIESYKTQQIERVRPQEGNPRNNAIVLADAIRTSSLTSRIDTTSRAAFTSLGGKSLDLTGYTSIVWSAGEQSGGLTSAEMSKIRDFVQRGGNLFLSGADIADGLEQSAEGRTFLAEVLGLRMATGTNSDRATSFRVTGQSESIFNGLSLSYDKNVAFYHSIDSSDPPEGADVLQPVNEGSTTALRYGADGSLGAAAVQKQGKAGAGNVVTLGFPFETLVDSRSTVMKRVLEYLGVRTESLVSDGDFGSVAIVNGGRDMAIVGHADHNVITVSKGSIRIEANAHRGDSALVFPQAEGLSRIIIASNTAGGMYDFRGSPLPVVFLGGPGNDEVYGSAFNDQIFGGGGNDFLRGMGGADDLYAGAGRNSVLDGGDGDDRLFGSGSDDRLIGGPGRDEFSLIANDRAVDAGADDHVTSPTPRAAKIQRNRIDQLIRDQQNRAVASHIPVVISANPTPQIASFVVDDAVVPQGDGVVFTLRATESNWGRLELFVDQNGNGQYDVAVDRLLGQFRGRNQDWAGQITTRDLMPGTYSIRARLLPFSGQPALSNPILLTIEPPPAQLPSELLPRQLTIDTSDVLPLVPHRNGDVYVPDAVLAGEGTIDFWQLTPRTAGNFSIGTEGDTDTVVAIYDAQGRRLGDVDSDAGPGQNGSLIRSLNADTTYYFCVTTESSSGGHYSIRMTGHNQTVSSTITLDPATNSGETTGNLSPLHRLDYIQVRSPSTATVLDVVPLPDAGLKLWVRVADGANEMVGRADLGDPNGRSLLENLPVRPDTTYYITLFSLEGTGGNYRLTADFYPDEPGFVADLSPTPAATWLIPHFDGTLTTPDRSIAQGSEIDYYLVTPPSGGAVANYTFEAHGNLDTRLALYQRISNDHSLLLGQDDDSGEGRNAKLAMSLVPGDEYILAVRTGNGETGDYSLQVTAPQPSIGEVTAEGLEAVFHSSTHFISNIEHFQMYRVKAPSFATTLDVRLEYSSSSHPDYNLNSAIRITDANRSELVYRDNAGARQDEFIDNLAVDPGKYYYLTFAGENLSIGDYRFHLDFDPNFPVTSGNEFPVSSGNFAKEWPGIARNSAGQGVAVWTTEVNYDHEVHAIRIGADGKPLGREFRIDQGMVTSGSRPTPAVANDGSFVVMWDNRIRRFSASGTPLTPALPLVSGVTPYERSLAMMPDGTFIVTWTSFESGDGDGDIYAQRYASDMSLTGGVFRINATTLGYQDQSDITFLPNGDWVATWVSDLKSGTRTDIRARVFRGDTPLTNEFTVNQQLGGPEFAPAVAASLDGHGYVIIWRTQHADGAYHIHGRRFGVDHQPLADEFQATTRSVDSTVFADPEVVRGADGRFLVLSVGNDANGRGVLGQQFDGMGKKIGPEFVLNQQQTRDQYTVAATSFGSDKITLVWWSNERNPWEIRGLEYTLRDIREPEITILDDSGEATDLHISFGDVRPQDKPGSHTLTVRNDGNADLVVDDIQLGGSDQRMFAVSPSGDFTLTPGESRQLSISFLPDGGDGPAEAVLSVSHNDTSDVISGDVDARPIKVGIFANVVVPQTLILQLLEATVSESSGEDATLLRVTRSRATSVDDDLEVNLTSSDPGETTLPAAVTIPAGQLSKLVPVRAIDDTLLDGAQLVALRARSPGFLDGQVQLQVADFETLVFSTSATSMSEAGGAVIGTVTRSNTDLDAPTLVFLSSDSDGEVDLPAWVVIPPLEASVSFTIRAVDDDESDGTTTVLMRAAAAGFVAGSTSVTVTDHELPRVQAFTPTSSGFELILSKAVDVSVFNLYDQGGQFGPADVTLTGNVSGPIRGSIVVAADQRTMTFVRTAGTLPPDTYTVRMRSATNGVKDINGNLLDGNDDGSTGDDYTTTFTVSAMPANAVTASLPDFTRGFGQPVNLPANSPTAGLPLQLSNGLGVSRVDLTLRFDPALLAVTNFAVEPALAARGATATFSIVSPGVAALRVTSPVSFATASGVLTMGRWTAQVPDDATYGAKHVLDLTDLHIWNDAATPAELPSVANDAIHVAAFFGDANGSKSYNSPDATLTRRIIGLVNTGLSAYQLADPVLLVDITQNNAIQSNDTTNIRRKIGQLDVPNIPPLPTGITPPPATGLDPQISLPRDLAALPGGTVRVPVRLGVTEPQGITLSGLDVVISFDPARFSVDGAALGNLFAGSDAAGDLSQPQPGTLIYSIHSLAGTGRLPFDTQGDLFTVTFRVSASAADGLAALNLRSELGPTTTAIYDNGLSSLVLSPAPTNADNDAVDGLVRIAMPLAAAGAAPRASLAKTWPLAVPPVPWWDPPSSLPISQSARVDVSQQRRPDNSLLPPMNADTSLVLPLEPRSVQVVEPTRMVHDRLFAEWAWRSDGDVESLLAHDVVKAGRGT